MSGITAPVRRRSLSGAAVVIVTVALVGLGWRTVTTQDAPDLVRVVSDDGAVQAAEVLRRSPTASVREVALTAAPTTLELDGRARRTWAFNGSVPGPEIRLRAGDVLRATVTNDLPAPFTVHWHGIALRNDMDGVPGVTQDPIPPGQSITYEFTVSDPGTYLYHSHVGTQLDRGTYGALVVDDPSADAPLQDIPMLVDDWIDGTGTDPDQVYEGLLADSSGSMSGMGMSATYPAEPLGADTGDVVYPYYLINGRGPAAPRSYDVAPGKQVRVRLINAGADTAFRVAAAGSRMTVVATDGFPVRPVVVDTLLLGMGERYDVLVTAPATGAMPVVAVAEGKQGQALAVLRVGPGPAPAADVTPAELTRRLLALADLQAAPDATLPAGTPDRTYPVMLTGGMQGYRWGLEVPSRSGVSLPVRRGERIRLQFENRTMMFHPMHLHGHTPQVVNDTGDGPRKDTVIVPPMGRVTVDIIADNPGQWLLHCHNGYHAEAGMLTTLSYVS